MHKVSDEPWLYTKLQFSFTHYVSYYSIIVLNAVLAARFHEITEIYRIAEEKFCSKHGLNTGIIFLNLCVFLAGLYRHISRHTQI
jgi:hypothetical protein